MLAKINALFACSQVLAKTIAYPLWGYFSGPVDRLLTVFHWKEKKKKEKKNKNRRVKIAESCLEREKSHPAKLASLFLFYFFGLVRSLFTDSANSDRLSTARQLLSICLILHNYILDIAPFNIKMVKSALHEFKSIYVHTIEISEKPNTKRHTTDHNPLPLLRITHGCELN